MNYIYFYNNESRCAINSFNEFDLFSKKIENYISHSKEVSKKTICKEKGTNKFLHIFKRHKKNNCDVWKWYASYCI